MNGGRMGNFHVTLEGHGKATFRQSDHVATGGEGSVYRLGDFAIKIYTDPLKMQKDDMADKIRALTALKHSYIVAPEGLVLDSHGMPVGLYMPYVEGEPFPRVFTNAYRTRTGFNDKDAHMLVGRMQEVVQFAHEKRAIIVDGNELSWLLAMRARRDPEPRIIDVDSWSVGRWPPQVIMPSIRDWHTSTFNELTDWFAWGIVSFQIYTGIHPYKGTLAGYQHGELERRMKKNASVFAQGVRLNSNVRDFSGIPSKLLAWYVDTFQHGMRQVPPSPFDSSIGASQAAVIARTVVTATGSLMYEKLYSNASDPAIRVFSCGVVLLASGRLYDLQSKREIGSAKSRDCEVIQTEGYWLIADWDSGSLEFTAVSAHRNPERLQLSIKGHRLLQANNRLFVHTDQGLTELKFMIVGRPILAPDHTWGVMRYSTQWFDGAGIMDAMGATFIVAPFGDRAVAQVRVPELDDLRPVAAYAGNRFMAIVGINKQGQYKKIELTFDSGYTQYDFWEGPSDGSELNMTMLPRGVAAIIIQDGEFSIFVPTSGTLNKIRDKGIATDMSLARWDNTVVYIRKGEVWSMRMR